MLVLTLQPYYENITDVYVLVLFCYEFFLVHMAPSSDSKLYCVPKVWPKLSAVKKDLFSSGDLLGSIISSMVPVAKPKEEND